MLHCRIFCQTRAETGNPRNITLLSHERTYLQLLDPTNQIHFSVSVFFGFLINQQLRQSLEPPKKGLFHGPGQCRVGNQSASSAFHPKPQVCLRLVQRFLWGVGPEIVFIYPIVLPLSSPVRSSLLGYLVVGLPNSTRPLRKLQRFRQRRYPESYQLNSDSSILNFMDMKL